MAIVFCLGSGATSLACCVSRLDDIVAAKTDALDETTTRQIDLPGIDSAFKEYMWNLETKYYSAGLKLWAQDAVVIGMDTGLEVEAESRVQEEQLRKALKGVIEQVEGVVLTFDPTVEGSFEEATRWADLLSSLRDGEESPELQLIVSMKSATPVLLSPSLSPEQRMQFVEWSLDHAFEFIEAELDVESLRTGMLEREKEGIPRVREAAEATRWSNLKMKDRSGSSNGNIQQRVLSSNQETLSTSIAETSTNESGRANPTEYIPGDLVVVHGLKASAAYNDRVGRVSRFDEEKVRFVVKLRKAPDENRPRLLAVAASNLRRAYTEEERLVSEEDNNQVSSAAQGAAALCTPPSDGSDDAPRPPPPPFGEGEGGGDLEVQMNQLESMIAEVKAAREAAKAGDVDDDTRRAKAAELAMRLLGSLGEGDDDAVDDEEEEGE